MKRLFLLLAMCLYLSGCAHKVEISKLGVVAGVGIDKTETGYLMTAQVVNPSSVAGNHQETLPTIVIQAEGSTLFEAYRRLTTLTSKELYLPHLGVIVIDENIARDGINDVLDLALRNVEIRPNITLMVAKGVMASNILSTLSPNETIPITQLNTVSNTCDECTGRLVKYNLYDVINMVNAKGINLVLNSVELKSNDPSSGDNVENLLQSNSPAQFNVNHLATFKDDKMVGYLDSHEAEFYNVLKNKAKRYVLVTQLEDEYYVAFEAIQTKTKITPNIDDNKFSVKCEVSGEIMENQYPIDLSKPANMEIVEGYLEEALKVNLTELIKKTQIELKSDIIGVGSQIYFKDTKRWKQLQGYWSDIYPTLSFDVEVNVKLIAVGDIQDLQKP